MRSVQNIYELQSAPNHEDIAILKVRVPARTDFGYIRFLFLVWFPAGRETRISPPCISGIAAVALVPSGTFFE